jgi:hypothetical protein
MGTMHGIVNTLAVPAILMDDPNMEGKGNLAMVEWQNR